MAGLSVLVRSRIFACRSKQTKRAHLFALFFVANRCKCEDGVAEAGAHCPLDGMAKCKSCNSGWTLNYAKAKCMRTWAYIYSHKQTG